MSISSYDLEVAKRKGIFGTYARYAILVISTLCLTTVVSNSMALNFTVICMSPPAKEIQVNGSTEWATTSAYGTYGVPRLSTSEEGYLFSAVALGTLIGTIPLPHLITSFGFRIVFTVFGISSCLSTLALPLVARWGFVPILIARIVQGIAVACSFPSLGAVTSSWSTLKEQGFYLAIISSHIQLAEILTTPIAGTLCESTWGWPSVFYFQGTLTGLFFIVFFIFYRDSPKTCWYVTSTELRTIEKGKDGGSTERPAVPYFAMCKDTAVWACFLAGLAAAASFNIFAQYGPTYLNKVLDFNVEGTGFLFAIPYVCSIAAKMISGPLSDRLSCLSVRTRVIMFTFYALLLNFACFLVLGLVPSASSTLALVLITAVIASNGLGFVGLARNAQVIALHHSHFIMAVISLINCFAILFMPTFVSAVAPDYSPSQWSIIFYINAGIILAANILFLIFAKTSARSWAVQAPKFPPACVSPAADVFSVNADTEKAVPVV